MSYTLEGTLKVKGDTQQVSDSFKKREFVLLVKGEKSDQNIQFQLVQDNCGLIDQFITGQPIRVHFFLQGREWTNPKDGQVRFFNTLNAVRIELVGASTDEVFDSEDDPNLPF